MQTEPEESDIGEVGRGCHHEWAFDACLGVMDTVVCLGCSEVRAEPCVKVHHQEDPEAPA